MAVAAPTPGAPETRAVRAMFDRIAPRYDLLNRLLSAGIDVRWRRAAVACLDAREGGRVLDLCTGTADLMIEQLGRGTRAVGVDLSREMLARGLAKVRDRHGNDGRLVCGDVQRLPFRDGRFDGAIVAFGIRNVGDPVGALREWRRVLTTGARLVILEFSMPRGMAGRLYRLYFRHLLPAIGGLVSGDAGAYAYLPASVERFATATDLSRLLRDTGFVDVEEQPLTGGVAHIHRGTRAA